VDTAYIQNLPSKPIISLPSHNTVANPVLLGVSKAPIPRQQKLKETATCAQNSEHTEPCTVTVFMPPFPYLDIYSKLFLR
jgi:hypothetical protein